MNPALRASAAHVFVESLDSIALDAGDDHHLFRVLRLRDGQAVTVSDGRGSWLRAVVTDRALVPTSNPIVEPPLLSTTIGTAIPKGDRVEWMVQKLTELGADEIALLHCERSVVRWDGERAQRQMVRLARVAREAAMQSRRVWLPRLAGPIDFAQVAKLPTAIVADPDGEPVDMFTGRGRDAVVVLIGPEGGLTDPERALCSRAVNLGRHILRIETAAVAAMALFSS